MLHASSTVGMVCRRKYGVYAFDSNTRAGMTNVILCEFISIVCTCRNATCASSVHGNVIVMFPVSLCMSNKESPPDLSCESKCAHASGRDDSAKTCGSTAHCGHDVDGLPISQRMCCWVSCRGRLDLSEPLRLGSYRSRLTLSCCRVPELLGNARGTI